MTTRSADECEMSRSCQSATFSSPTTALRRGRRARARRSARRRSGCACAASPTSPSGRCRTAPRPRAPRCARGGGSRARTSRATRRSSASAREQLGVPVALDDLRRAGAGSSPSRSQAMRSTSGSIGRVRADGARELADAHPLERARDARSRSRSSSNAQPASFSPNVVGSAWTPCVRPMHERAPVLLGARDDGRERALDALEDRARRPPHLQRERRVDDVGRGEAVVEPAALRRRAARRRRRRTRRRRGAVSRLELGDALGRRRDARVADRVDGVRAGRRRARPSRRAPRARPRASARACASSDQIARHGRAGVAGDHGAESSARSGAPRRLRRPTRSRAMSRAVAQLPRTVIRVAARVGAPRAPRRSSRPVAGDVQDPAAVRDEPVAAQRRAGVEDERAGRLGLLDAGDRRAGVAALRVVARGEHDGDRGVGRRGELDAARARRPRRRRARRAGRPRGAAGATASRGRRSGS